MFTLKVTDFYLLVYLTTNVLSMRDDTTCSNAGSLQWNFLISNQSELEQFVENARWNHSKCIHLSLAGTNSYTLDIVDFMNVTSFSIGSNGSLIIQGIGGKVDINCTSSYSDLNGLLQILRPISNALLVILDGLVFNSCPVPVLIEEVSTVVVKNCVFL